MSIPDSADEVVSAATKKEIDAAARSAHKATMLKFAGAFTALVAAATPLILGVMKLRTGIKGAGGDGTANTDPLAPTITAGIFLVLAGIGAGVLFFGSIMLFRTLKRKLEVAERARSRYRRERDGHRAELKKISERKEELEDVVGRQGQERMELEENAIRMMRPEDYLPTLVGLIQRYGPGHLLLFNVELNSFSDDRLFTGFWGRLTEHPEVKSVQLALPPRKFARWERIVTGVRAEYFADAANGARFCACEYGTRELADEDRIAFALYAADAQRGVHNWGALFLLNRPFVEAREDGSDNYRHILEYNGDHDVLSKCRELWDSVYDDAWAETARDIQVFRTRDDHGADPPDLAVVFDEHNCDQKRRKRIKRVVDVVRRVDDDQRRPRPALLHEKPIDGRGYRTFELTYRRDPALDGPIETVRGYFKGLPDEADAEPKPCVIWASGFGDGQQPRLSRVLSRGLQKRDMDFIEVFFAKSGEIRDTTCSRVYEDLGAVLDYVTGVPAVDKARICLVGISLSGYLATKLAMRNESVNSLVLVAPPFDIVEMLDAFREHYLGQRMERVPSFADFLKARPGLRIADWDMSPDFCTYFNHTVTASHLVDLAIQGRHKFGRRTFMRALADITHGGRKIAIIYGEDDPIVDSERNIRMLKERILADAIDRDMIQVRSVPMAHFYPARNDGEGGEYPIKFPDPSTHPADMHRVVAELADAIAQSIDRMITPPEISTMVEDERIKDGNTPRRR